VKRKRLHNFLGKFHVYGGLFSVGFLLAFSYSAFVHQHHPKFPKPGDHTVHWEQKLEIPEIEDNNTFKLAVRDSMRLFGYVPWWEDYTDSLGIHHFMITRPGKQYWVTVPTQGDLYKVKEIRTGFWNVLNQLHPMASGLSGHGNGPFFIEAWRWISLPMAIVLFGVVLITIYFWFKRSFNRKRSWVIVGSIALFPIILIIFIWLVG
jgi:hypothetical protein